MKKNLCLMLVVFNVLLINAAPVIHYAAARRTTQQPTTKSVQVVKKAIAADTIAVEGLNAIEFESYPSYSTETAFDYSLLLFNNNKEAGYLPQVCLDIYTTVKDEFVGEYSVAQNNIVLKYSGLYLVANNEDGYEEVTLSDASCTIELKEGKYTVKGSLTAEGGQVYTFEVTANADIVFGVKDSGTCGNNVGWTLYEDSTLTIYGAGAIKNYDLSKTAPWYSSYNKFIKNIIIQDGVTGIGDCAFRGCTSLTSVTIPNSVTSIGHRAFDGCTGLTSVALPNSVSSIGNFTFNGCTGLTSPVYNANVFAYIPQYFEGPFVISDGIKLIGGGAFYYCSGLTSITIPNSVTSIGEYAFNGCSSLTSVTIGNSVTSIGKEAFSCCSGLAILTVPNSVTSIGEYAFNGCSGLTSVTIGNSVTSIGKEAFRLCSSITSVIWNAKKCTNSGKFGSQVTSFTFGDEVEFIPDSCCSGMKRLTSVTIPKSVTRIMYYAFSSCSSITSVIWNAKKCTDSGKFGSQVTSFTFGDEVELIPNRCCNKMNKLTSMTIPNSVTSIEDFAFDDCTGLTSVTIGSRVTSIGNSAFSGCTGLTRLAFPNTLKTIGNKAFQGCKDIESISFGAGLESVGDYAFADCIRIDSMTCPTARTPDATAHTFDNVSRKAYLYVLSEYVRKFEIDPYWGEFDIRTLGAKSVANVTDVTIVANSDNAVFTWPANDVAQEYTLQITKDGVVFCTLRFSANGNLLGIAFKPGHDHQAKSPAALLANGGYTFAVTGLDAASKYNYNLNVTDANSQSLASYKGEFVTQGYKQTYIVIFYDWDGTVLDTQVVEAGHDATAPTEPTRDGYTFTGWDKAFTNIQSDLSVTAQYKSNGGGGEGITTYTVQFVDWDDSILKEQSVEKGQDATAPADPSRDGYTFKGWDKEFTNVQSDLVVKAVYEKNPDEAIDDVNAENVISQKVLQNGQLLILRNGEIYNAQGARVK